MLSLFPRRELEEQAEEYEEMYEKRFKLLQQSVKKATSRKRRRQEDGVCASKYHQKCLSILFILQMMLMLATNL